MIAINTESIAKLKDIVNRLELDLNARLMVMMEASFAQFEDVVILYAKVNLMSVRLVQNGGKLCSGDFILNLSLVPAIYNYL